MHFIVRNFFFYIIFVFDYLFLFFFFFFFQAEDGIRDYKVTGVQTCALPISCALRDAAMFPRPGSSAWARLALPPPINASFTTSARHFRPRRSLLARRQIGRAHV